MKNRFIRANGGPLFLFGFLLSGQSFVQIATPLLSGVTNPSNEISFFTAMHAKWGVGHSLQDYLNTMIGPKGVANMTAIRMNCS